MGNKFSSRVVVVGLVFSMHGHQVVISESAEALASEAAPGAPALSSQFVQGHLDSLAGEVCSADSLNSGCSVPFSNPGSTVGLFPSFQQECVSVDVQISGLIIPTTRCFGI